jgi:hypothetical protein
MAEVHAAAPPVPEHPVLEAVSAARGGVAGVLAGGAWSLSDAHVRDGVRAVVALRAQVDAALLMLVREVSSRGGYTEVALSPAAWLGQVARLDPGEARAVTRLAGAITGAGDTTTPGGPDSCAGAGREGSATGAGLAAGAFSTAHAEVIIRVLAGLPRQLEPAVRVEAEALLAGEAQILGPRELARVGRVLHEALAARLPDVDDPADAAAVAAELERAARDRHARRCLHWTVDGQGTVAGRFRLPGQAGAAFITAVEAYGTAGPSHPDPGSDPGVGGGDPDPVVRDERTLAQRRADALEGLARGALDAGTLPQQGGERPHVGVTLNYEALLARLPEAGVLHTGGTLTPEQCRLLLCDAQIIPIVLGGAGQVLDVGRASRDFTIAMRRGITARDRGCVFPGCDRPPAHCQAHHMDPHWSGGAHTSVDLGALLCLPHHRQVHMQGWIMRLAANGYPEVTPPGTIDPQRRPRQHTRFRLRHLGRADPPGEAA